jgi:hypothetical protein
MYRQAIDGTEWLITTVYGPARDQEKQDFLDEMHDLRAL